MSQTEPRNPMSEALHDKIIQSVLRLTENTPRVIEPALKLNPNLTDPQEFANVLDSLIVRLDGRRNEIDRLLHLAHQIKIEGLDSGFLTPAMF